MDEEKYQKLLESCREYFMQDGDYERFASDLSMAHNHRLYSMNFSNSMREKLRIILIRESYYTGRRVSVAELIRQLLEEYIRREENQMLLLDFPPGPNMKPLDK